MVRAAMNTISLVVLAACASPPPAPVLVDKLVEKTATVEAVYLPTRMVALRGEDGRTATVMAGPEVRNLDQVQVGDRVTVSYYEGIAAEVKKSGEGVEGVEESGQTVAARPGQRPAGAVGSTVRTTVRIESVDTSANTVTFRSEDGLVRTIPVFDPDARRFIRELRPGQDVEITYTEAVAVEVRPAG
jgi:hypothetical protein